MMAADRPLLAAKKTYQVIRSPNEEATHDRIAPGAGNNYVGSEKQSGSGNECITKPVFCFWPLAAISDTQVWTNPMTALEWIAVPQLE